MKIIDSLMDNSCLAWFEIICDEVSARTCRALADMLCTNVALTSLVLKSNGISCGSGIDCISDSLRVNSTLMLLE